MWLISGADQAAYFGVLMRARKSPAPCFHRRRGVTLATSYFRTTYRRTIIGATAFHFRVRNGNGWCHCAGITRRLSPRPRRRSSRRKLQASGDGFVAVRRFRQTETVSSQFKQRTADGCSDICKQGSEKYSTANVTRTLSVWLVYRQRTQGFLRALAAVAEDQRSSSFDCV